MQVSKNQSEFRRDINGLRAWAVVGVILYHFGVPGFGGGFIGVDIFFVISGFLMTGIVIGKLDKGTFSILDFYLARAKRIVPALAVLCACLLAIGWFVVMSPDYKTLGSHAIYSLLFLSNIEYWKEAGYFDVDSHEKWLLHTWSLSVEWQFYLLLPVVLCIVWRLKPGRSAQLWTLAACLLVSLAACILQTKSQPTAAFFLLHTRAWEMICGGLVWLLSGRARLGHAGQRWLETAGLLLIVASNFVFDKHSAWPGAGAMMPVAGTMMVLIANRMSPWTGSTAAQWLGDRSYSLYLWHWPVYVALVYVELRYEPWATAGGMVATVLLAHLSYVLVEARTRQLFARIARPRALAALALIGVVAALPAFLVWYQKGVAGRHSAGIEFVAAEAKNYNPRRDDCQANSGDTSPSCKYGKGTHRVIILGDSHAGALVSGVANGLTGSDAEVTEWSYSGCPFVFGVKISPADLAGQPKGYRCSDFISWATTQLAETPASVPVIIVGRYAASAYGKNEAHDAGVAPRVYFSRIHTHPTDEFINEFSRGITRTACELAKQRTVYLMRPIPEMGVDVPRTLARRMSFGIQGDITMSTQAYFARNKWVWAAQDAARDACGVKILDPLAYLCSDGTCFGSKAGRPLYHDDDHLSGFGNKLLAPMYKTIFEP